jgi:hypothetical protein
MSDDIIGHIHSPKPWEESRGGKQPWEESQDGEALLHKCCAELGVNMAMAIQIVAWADENCQRSTFSAEMANVVELLKKQESKHRQAWHFLISYQANQKAEIPNLKKNLTLLAGQAWNSAKSKDRPQIKEQFQKISDEIDEAVSEAIRTVSFSTRVMALELDFTTAAGADSVAELGRICGLSKQTVNKCSLNFQPKLGLPPRPGQRCEAARTNMTEARKNQLNNKLSHTAPTTT